LGGNCEKIVKKKNKGGEGKLFSLVGLQVGGRGVPKMINGGHRPGKSGQEVYGGKQSKGTKPGNEYVSALKRGGGGFGRPEKMVFG